MKKLRLILTAMALIFMAGSQTVVSAAAGGGSGMRVSPVRTDAVMQAGTTKTISIYVKNVTESDETLQVIANDFTANKDETGAPALLLNGGTNAQHGLKTYLSLPKTVKVAAGQQKEVKATISLPKSVAPGGYYGAVRFAPATEPGGVVSLSGSVGSIILVTVPGNIKENLQVASLDVRRNDNAGFLFTSTDKLTATVRFRNSGNVQERPFGKIQLKKGGKVLATYEVNNTTPRGNVLPDSIRKFTVPLKDVHGFGKYALEGNFGYGDKGQLLTASTTFVVVPMPFIVLGGVLILLVLFLIFALPKLLRRYNQSVIKRAGRG